MKDIITKEEMKEYMNTFEGMPDRLMKYMEILSYGKDASPYCYQDTMSFRRVAIAITTFCNLTCTWCYRFDSKYKKILDKHMKIETLQKIIDNTKGNFRLTHLAGLGEPLMYPHLEEAIKIVKRKSKHVKITTNGSLITKDDVNRLSKAGLTHIEFSIDGFTFEDQLKFRGADLNKMVEMIEYISNHTNLHLQINSVVNKQNYNSLFNLVNILKNAKNIKIIHTIPLFVTEQMIKDGENNVVDNEEYQKLLVKIETDIQTLDLKWELSPTSIGVGMDPIIEIKKRQKICFTCFEDPYIDVEGRLTVCGRREFHPIADATKGLEVAMNEKKAIGFRKNMLAGKYDSFCSRLCYLPDKNIEYNPDEL
ncbi:MAG: hypothetical protein C0626_12710 [Arcobacter sp.]|uniref:radical SAM protein n=1 Tax=uncultured Arcobacter sp. TaxID=165434 RepID=UPI000CC9409D|nr:radical SAM protein [uncultured Arcobacter sp.]PLY08703.1 MAG: hypothetical protein C0626_12710 [Arcobacter sp.]